MLMELVLINLIFTPGVGVYILFICSPEEGGSRRQKKCGRKIIPQNRLSGKQTRVNTQYTPLSERQAIPKSEIDS